MQGGAWSFGTRAARGLENRRLLVWWLSATVLLLAAAGAWTARHAINPDGISYLDVGNAVFAHGIKAAANVTRSPAYTWILGAALQFLHPSRPHELIVVMAVNVAIVAVLLAVFARWLSELCALLRSRGLEPLIPEPVLVLLAYGILAWAVLRGVAVSSVTPDMLVALAGFAASAVLMRIARLGGAPLTWTCLGILLGLGYLAKSGFVAVALVACAAAAVLSAGNARRRVLAFALTLAACLCIAAPFVGVLSSKEGRLEIGSYGTLNYAWYVDRVTPDINWTGGNGEFGRPVHPTLIATSPNTFAYPGPIAGSIPIWYDPSYWYQGVHARFMLGGQVRATAHSVFDILDFAVIGPLLLLSAPVLMLRRALARDEVRARTRAVGTRARLRRTWHATRHHAYLALPAAGIATYVPLHTESRFIAGYVAIIAITWFMVICGWRRWERASQPTVDRIALATTLVALITLVYAALVPLEQVATQLAGHDAPGTVDLRVARTLTRTGIEPGEGIAFVGSPSGIPRAYYARLDHARLVGNVNDPGGAFWRLTPSAQADRLSLLRARSGARVAVSDQAQARTAPGWKPIAGTGYSYRLLADGWPRAGFTSPWRTAGTRRGGRSVPRA